MFRTGLSGWRGRKVGEKMPRWPHVTSAVVLMIPDSDDSIFVPLEDGQVREEGVSTERGMATSISAAMKAAGMCVTTRAVQQAQRDLSLASGSGGCRIVRVGAGGAARVAAQQQDGMEQVGKRTW